MAQPESLPQVSVKYLKEEKNLEVYRAQLIKMLGGDACFYQSGLAYPFSGFTSRASRHFFLAAVRMALRMTPRSERKKDGTLPLLLVRSVNLCIKQRREAKNRSSEKVVVMDFVNAVKLMQSWAVEDASEFVAARHSFCCSYWLRIPPLPPSLSLSPYHNQMIQIYFSQASRNRKKMQRLVSFQEESGRLYLRSARPQSYGGTPDGKTRS